MELFQRLVAEARSDVADVSPGLLFPHPKRESSEIRACPPGSGKSDDDDLLTFRGLDFQPVVGAAAGSVSSIGALRQGKGATSRNVSYVEGYAMINPGWLFTTAEPVAG